MLSHEPFEVGSRSANLNVDQRDIVAVASALGASPSAEVVAALATWLGELVQWNKAHDLTAARSKDELCDLMLADAFVLSQRLPEGATFVDVGVGAGAPGLALALMRPDLRATLVEPLQKRVGFMRLVIGKLDRTDVVLEPKRGEALERGQWEVALSRATLAPAEWLALGRTLVREGGEVIALLAREAPPACEGLAARETFAYEWPCTKVARTLVRYVTE